MAYKLSIHKDVLKYIDELSQHKNELCGMLLGYKLCGKNEYRIEVVTKPTEHDKSTEVECYRDLDSHDNQYHELALLDPKVNYHGEYHTHPEFFGSNPSAYDCDERVRYTKKSSKKNKKIFFLTKAPNDNFVIYMSWISGRVFKTYNEVRGKWNGRIWLFNE